MTSRREMRILNDMRNLIVKEGAINKYDLMIRSEISVSYYDKLSPILQHLYGPRIEYDRRSKNWLDRQTHKKITEEAQK